MLNTPSSQPNHKNFPSKNPIGNDETQSLCFSDQIDTKYPYLSGYLKSNNVTPSFAFAVAINLDSEGLK